MAEPQQTISETAQNTLVMIQNELNVPKNHYNNFGDFHYRNCEDILNALKPLLFKHHAVLTMKDEPVMIGDRYYIKATAEFNADDISKTTCAFAREPSSKPKMDDSQVTGSTSSYARKYALNGMFLIDDMKDTDTNDYHRQTSNVAPARNTRQMSRQNTSSLNAKKRLVNELYKKIADSMQADAKAIRAEAIKQAATKPEWEKANDAGKQAILLNVLNEMDKALVKK